MSAALKIFIIYAREDESFKNSLLIAFTPLRRTGKIEIFHDALIKPGDRWEDIILENLRTAHIILPLVSNDFFGSEFIHEVEFKNAVERYNKGETVIFPIILKPCGWKYDPLIKSLQVLPKDGKPVVTWTYPEEAWEQVLDAVHEVTENVEKKKHEEKEKKEAETRRKKEEAEANKIINDAVFFYDLGFNATDDNEKIVHYSKAIEINPDYAVAYYNRGCAKDDLQQHNEAIYDYDQAIRLDPEYALAYFNRGNSKYSLGQNEAAVKDYDEAIRLIPDYNPAYNNRGVSKQILGFFSEAILDFKKALLINPNHETAKINLKNLEAKMK